MAKRLMPDGIRRASLLLALPTQAVSLCEGEVAAGHRHDNGSAIVNLQTLENSLFNALQKS